jgi:hypothetical protein
MHPLDSSVTDTFSPCSVDQICTSLIKHGFCLKDTISNKTVQSSVCGNGVKEANEECDCGSAEDCAKDPCCASDCKLRSGKKCSDRNDLCCENCSLKVNGTICRPSTGFCDVEERCNGASPDCPANLFKNDGTACTVNSTTAQCVFGQCTSRDLQCLGKGVFKSVRACRDFSSECELHCEDSKGVCLQLNGLFLDGTPCGLTGRCLKGVCIGDYQSPDLLTWYKSNLSISIPVTVVAAGLIILVIFCCCVRCCRIPGQSSRQKKYDPASTEDAAVVARTRRRLAPLQLQVSNTRLPISTLVHTNSQVQADELIPLQPVYLMKGDRKAPPPPYTD